VSNNLKLTAAEWHRQQAIDLFNFTWTLIDKPDRTAAADEVVARAHACAGQTAKAQKYHRLAEQAGEQIAE
jgi:hypothetical protein